MPAAAEHRRRRLRALGVVAGVAALIGVVVGASSGGDGPAAPPPVVSFCARPATTPEQVAGQGVMVRMKDKATPPLLRLARTGEIGGVTLFPDTSNYGALHKQVEALQAAAERGGNPPLLIAIDQEGGIVKRLASIPPQLSPYTLAQNDSAAASRLEGKATGFQLRKLGIGIDLAPVLDVPESPNQFMAVRAFGSSSAQVTRLGLPFARGLMEKGVAATAKHFPGLGRAVENTDFAPTTISASKSQLREDLKPFQAAIDSGVPLVMISSAAYPGLGAGKAPASLSPEIVTGLLRERLGFTGVVITDDLQTPAIEAGYPAGKAAIAATEAGVDVKLFAGSEGTGIAAGLARASAQGRVATAALAETCERVVALKGRIDDRSPELAVAEPAPTDDSDTQ